MPARIATRSVAGGECGSVGVLRQGIAPRDREVGDAEGAVDRFCEDERR